MENASKALLMAGGVLIGILILGLLVYMFNNNQIIPQSEKEKQKAEQLAEFNLQYESYSKKFMYGTDVISVINKAIENNKQYTEEQKNYDINVKIQLKLNLELSSSVMYAGEHSLTDYSQPNKTNKYILELVSDETAEQFKTFKRKYFKCTDIKYDKETGRINCIIFKEMTYNGGTKVIN